MCLFCFVFWGFFSNLIAARNLGLVNKWPELTLQMLFHNNSSVISSQTWPHHQIQHQESALAEINGKGHEQNKKLPHAYENVGAAWFPRGELGSASPHGDVQLFPLPTVSGSHFQPAQFSLFPYGGVEAGECLKHNNAVGKQVLSVFLAIFPKEHFAATLSNFPVLCRFLAPPVSASPGLWWELSMKKSRRVWRASSIQACFPASGQGQVLFGRSSVPKVNYRWN